MCSIIEKVCSVGKDMDSEEIYKAKAFIDWYLENNCLPKTKLIASPLQINILENNQINTIKEEIFETNPWSLESKLTLWAIRRLGLCNYIFSKEELGYISSNVQKLLIYKDKDTINLYSYH